MGEYVKRDTNREYMCGCVSLCECVGMNEREREKKKDVFSHVRFFFSIYMFSWLLVLHMIIQTFVHSII